MVRRVAPDKRLLPTPGSPGAPDLITHLMRDHALGFYSDPPVRATRPDGQYDLNVLECDHRQQHVDGVADHAHDWVDFGGLIDS